VLAPLRLKLIYHSTATAPHTLGYGPDLDDELINLFQYKDSVTAPGPGCHITFNAPTRQAVRDFYEVAVRCGGKSNVEPGLRIHYGPTYFAAFVIDPDRWRLEVVYKSDKSEHSSTFIYRFV
jgi:hypothetical protein